MKNEECNICKPSKMVAKSGYKHNYTSDPREAEVFLTKDDAEKHRCENEILIAVTDIFLR